MENATTFRKDDRDAAGSRFARADELHTSHDPRLQEIRRFLGNVLYAEHNVVRSLVMLHTCDKINERLMLHGEWPRQGRDPIECTTRGDGLVMHMDKDIDMFHLDWDFNVPDVALTYIDGRRQMVCSLLRGLGGAQLVAEEPSLSRRSPALHSEKEERKREKAREREREVAGEEGDPAAARPARPARRCSGHAEAAGGEQWRRSRRVAVVVDAAGGATTGSRHGAESAASTAQTADGGQRRERAVAGSDLAAAAAGQQCRRASSDAAVEQCGRTSDAGGARQRLYGQQTRERLRRRCDATPARDGDRRAAARRRRLRDSNCDSASDDAMARCRPVGCAISSKSRRRDGCEVYFT
ncbi:hypothetical protein Scep_012689 [Stephania cephalantha]|uniref:Uncharacterized protein n=1 Tax=Stephania cephalantha TaxID=152367 RepID=A0AAP0JFE4_9MAGN